MDMTAHSGFTLTELVTVVAIVGILLAIGAPSYRYVTTSNRMSAEVNGLLGDLEFARAEAVKEGQTVTACTSSDGATCLIGNNTAWDSGWIVFSDPNGNAVVDPGEAVLRTQRPFSANDTFRADHDLNAVTFNREGFAVELPNAGVRITLRDATNNPSYARCLSIGLVGNVQIQTHATAANCP